MPYARLRSFAERELPWMNFDWSVVDREGGAEWARFNMRVYLTPETKARVRGAALRGVLEAGSEPAELAEPTSDGGG